MLLDLLTAAAISIPPQYDVFLGMPQKMQADIQGQIQTMRDVQAQDWTPRVEATTTIGPDKLVMWSWPMKGNHGIGLQVYGAGNTFKTRLEDSAIPSARAVVCGRYIAGGGNTLRVWDAAQEYKLIQKRTFMELGQFATLNCKGSILTADNRQLFLPSLRPVDIRLGLSTAEVASLNRSTQGHIDEAHTISQVVTSPNGDTLVTWSRTANYDPKGPREVGTQVYDKAGNFKIWLKGTRR